MKMLSPKVFMKEMRLRRSGRDLTNLNRIALTCKSQNFQVCYFQVNLLTDIQSLLSHCNENCFQSFCQ